MLISLADVLKNFLERFHFVILLKKSCYPIKYMFYNTKITPLFRTNSNIWQKSMFYNMFLDLNQK